MQILRDQKEGHLPYQGRSHQSRVGYGEKSAEAIVPSRKRAVQENTEVSQVWEGLNVFSSLNSIRKLNLCVFQPYLRMSKVLLVKRAKVLMSQRTAVYENRTYGGVRGALRHFIMAEPSTRLYAGYSIINFLVELFLSVLILHKYIPFFKLFKSNSIFSIPVSISIAKIFLPSKLWISMIPFSVLNSEHCI